MLKECCENACIDDDDDDDNSILPCSRKGYGLNDAKPNLQILT